MSSIEMKTASRAWITLETADAMVRAGAEFAQSIGKNMVIAIVDPAGHLVAFRRMDGAPVLSIGIAQDKAYTAAAFGLPTDQWHEFIKDDEPLRLGIVHTPRLVTFGGGYPIVSPDGELVGAIGVSGGHYTEDMQVAKAALQAVGVEPG
jgi:uncharacterized protein GlcG (DUF336 family)